MTTCYRQACLNYWAVRALHARCMDLYIGNTTEAIYHCHGNHQCQRQRRQCVYFAQRHLRFAEGWQRTALRMSVLSQQIQSAGLCQHQSDRRQQRAGYLGQVFLVDGYAHTVVFFHPWFHGIPQTVISTREPSDQETRRAQFVRHWKVLATVAMLMPIIFPPSIRLFRCCVFQKCILSPSKRAPLWMKSSPFIRRIWHLANTRSIRQFCIAWRCEERDSGIAPSWILWRGTDVFTYKCLANKSILWNSDAITGK